jgi:hypothetical protein
MTSESVAKVKGRWTPEQDKLLGTMRDSRLASRLKRTVVSVSVHRKRKGIPIFNSKVHTWTAEDDQILGTRPDKQIALLPGVTVMAVKHRRSRLGIGSRRKQERT